MKTFHKTLPAFVASSALMLMSCGDPGASGEDGQSTSTDDISLFNCPAGHVGFGLICIPRQCHGRSSRSENNLKCVLDESKPEVSVAVSRIGTPIAANGLALQTSANAATVASLARNNPIVYPATEYTWSFTVDVRLADELGFDEQFKPSAEPDDDDSFDEQFGRTEKIAPKELSFKVWLEDEYEIYDRGTRQSTVYKGYRCVATGFDIAPEDAHTKVGSTRRYAVSFDRSMSQDCESDGFVLSLENAARSSGFTPAGFDVVATYKRTNVHVSYDVDGDTVWHKNATTVDEVVNGEPECEPNPISMMYDSESKTYRYAEYYKQRKSGGEVTIYVPEAEVGRLGQIGPSSIQARRDLTIRPFASISQPLTIDFDYYVNNLNESHAFNPFSPKSVLDGTTSVTPGAAWRTNNLGTGNYAPTDLKAEFYLVPTDVKLGGSSNYTRSAALQPYKLAARALSKRDENTLISDTFNYAITKDVQKRFLDPSSPSYVQNDRRSFTLAYCITSSASAFSSLYSPNHLGSFETPRRDLRTIMWQTWTRKDNGNPMFSDRSKVPATKTFLDELVLDQSRASLLGIDRQAFIARSQGRSNYDPGVYLPFFGNPYGNNYNSYLHGCRRDPRPLLVTVDRFVSATEPISKVAYQGSLDAKETGDSSASGGNDNLHDIQCEKLNPNDSSDRRLDDSDCDEMLQIGGKSAGADSRSLYAIQSNSTREKNTEGKTAISASVRGEFMGFQLIDQTDADSNPFKNAVQGAQSSVSLNVQPPWDKIVSLLSKYNTDGQVRTEWKKGFGGEQNGLGYKLGFKIPFQIGPVPVVVIISFSIGANLSVDLSFQFQADAAEAYPCIGNETTDCAVLSSGGTSFTNANQTCQKQGGRLLEMSAQQEYDALQALRVAPDGSTVDLPGEIWVGAQTAFRVDDAKCSNNGSDECKRSQDTEIRWVSNSESIARARGKGRFDTTGWATRVFGPNINFDGVHFPNQKGAYYHVSTNELRLANKDDNKRFICHFERATSEDYYKFTVSTPLTLAAGVGVSGCVPSGKEIFCLNGDISFVEFKLTPGFSYTIHNIKRVLAGVTQTSKRSTAKLFATFAITLFPATFSASLDVWIATLTWTIATFDGIKLPTQTLYEESFPSIGGWE